MEVHSVQAAAAEAIAPDIPAGDTVPAILQGRIRRDPILPDQVRTAAVLRTLLVEVVAGALRPVPAQAPALAALARRVQAVLAVARAVALSGRAILRGAIVPSFLVGQGIALFRKRSFPRSRRLDCGPRRHQPRLRISLVPLS